MKNAPFALIKISLVLKRLFDAQTGEEMEDLKAHFENAYSDAQLCALAAVGLICRVFGLIPPQQPGTRSLWNIVSLFVQFLKGLSELADTSRAVPTPLDVLVEDALDAPELRDLDIED